MSNNNSVDGGAIAAFGISILAIGFVLGGAAATGPLGPMWDNGSSKPGTSWVYTVEDCATDPDYKGSKDDFCTVWTDEDGTVVIGPKWAKP